MVKKFANFLKTLKNSLDDDASAVAVAIQELITELEQSDDVFNVEQLTAKINDLLPKAVESSEVENRIRAMFNKFKLENTPKPAVNTQKEWKDKVANLVVTSKDAKSFRDGISGIPAAVEVFGEIATPWDADKGLFGAMRKIGSINTTIPYTEDDDADTLAKGHVPGDKKVDQDFDLDAKQLINQMIYKQVPINRADIYNYSQSRADRSAFIDWVLTELPERLYTSIERTVICGKGWQTTAAQQIKSFESIGDKTTSDAYTTVKSFDGAYATDADRNTILGDLLDLSIGVNSKQKAKWMYINPKLLAFLMKRLYASGGNYHFVGYDALAAELNVERILPYGYLGSGATDGDAMAVIITPRLYYRAGGEMFGEQWTAYEYNQECYRAEIMASGAIGGLASTAVYNRKDQ